MSRRAATGLGAALCVVVLLALGTGAGEAGPVVQGTEPVPPAPVLIRAWAAINSGLVTLPDLHTIALGLAASTGDPHPTSARFYETTRRKLNRVFTWGDSPSDGAVYMVVVRGQFVHNGPQPAESQVITCRIVAVVWDRANPKRSDYICRNQEIDTSSIGSGVNLLD